MSLPPGCPYRCEPNSGQQILQAIIVMSINSRIFVRKGSFTLKLLVLLKATIFTAALFSGFISAFSSGDILGSESSIDTFTASKVSTFEWNINKSDVSTLTWIVGTNKRTHIEFLSEEYSIQNSESERRCLNSLPSFPFFSMLISLSQPYNLARNSQKQGLLFDLSKKWNFTLEA